MREVAELLLRLSIRLMAKGLGRMDQGFGLGSVEGLPPKAAGLYPTKGKGLGEYGTVKFPSILEAYNRDSDFKRWKLGMDYYFGSGRTWGDYQILSLARFLPGAVNGISRDIVTLFLGKQALKAWRAFDAAASFSCSPSS